MTTLSPRQPAGDALRRPYAPPSHVIAVLKRARSRNLPDRITTDFLGLAGVPHAMAVRTTFALRFLALTEEDGSPTAALRAIAASGETEYGKLLEDVIRQAYATDFERVDPASDSQSAIVDAFARYQPRSQTARMVMTFLGLCREAGIPVLEAPRKRGMQSTGRRPARQGASPKPRSPAQPVHPSAAIPSRDGESTLFGVTESDISVLDEDEFSEVWTALGKVARARARARALGSASAIGPEEAGDEDQ